MTLLNSSHLSAAQVIVEELKNRGVDKNSIIGEDLRELNKKLTVIDSAGHLAKEMIDLPREVESIDRKVTAVIVETRQHRNLEFVVCQFAKNLGVDIQIFHGRSNKNFIIDSKIGKLVEAGQVTLSDLNVNSLDAIHYNALLLSQSFWDALRGRNKILIFQTDSVLCYQSDYCLNDFMCFDYIGSKWNRARPIGINIDGGSGGMSLRDWKKSKECLSRFPSFEWPGGEDGYFAFHLDLMGARVGRSNECAKFSSQGEFSFKSFACHSIHLMSHTDLKKFLEYAPEAKTILPIAQPNLS